MDHFFELSGRALAADLTVPREGETKLGEHIGWPLGGTIKDALANSRARFVLLGIPEDIGVRANGGIGGAHTTWLPALRAILNIQSTETLCGDELLLLGTFNFAEWMRESENASLDRLRDLVSNIDQAVAPVIEAIVAAGKIPLVIGGGHNNAYPLLKGTSDAMGKPVNCINLDAHSDYRMMEGRHSGNGFRYAMHEGYLDRYAIVGLHRNYNSQTVLNDLAASDRIDSTFYEDIFLREALTFEEAVAKGLQHISDKPTGIELDLDCIERTLTSAATPCGLTSLQARRYLHLAAQQASPGYLHLTEGAAALRDGRTDPNVAKLIAYLLSDFIRGMNCVRE